MRMQTFLGIPTFLTVEVRLSRASQLVIYEKKEKKTEEKCYKAGTKPVVSQNHVSVCLSIVSRILMDRVPMSVNVVFK